MSSDQLKNLKSSVHDIVFKSDTRAGKAFDIVLLVLIILSVLTVMLESVTAINREYRELFRTLETIYTVLFTIEFLLRVWASPSTRHYLFSFFGIVDLLSILPYYLSYFVVGSQYFMIIRVLRLLRVARIFKLTHFLKEADVLSTALRASFPKILVFIGTVLTLVMIIGSAMYVVEGGENGFTSIPKSIYWAIVTLTTVGYGDIAPRTPLGQIFAAFVMLLGYGIIAIPTGIVTVEIANVNRKAAKPMVCPNCQKASHEPGSRFCNTCGHALPA